MEIPFFPNGYIQMWWGGKLSEISDIIEPMRRSGEPCTFSIPDRELENLDENIELLGAMEAKLQLVKGEPGQCAFALPDGEASSNLTVPEIDPFIAFENVVPAPKLGVEPEYWSVDTTFWSKWKEQESSALLTSARDANALLEEARQAAEAKAAAAAVAEAERVKLEEANKLMSKKAEESQKVVVATPVAEAKLPTVSDICASFKTLMENGKKYRSEFMPIWREISLAVSTTAGNVRSIQMNATKLINGLSRASAQAGATRQEAVHWLAAVCGSKIVSQASSGNKSLVWSFAYLTRIVSEKFPDVARVGAIGELLMACPYILRCPGETSPAAPSQPQDLEAYLRVWIALMCVSGDQKSLWLFATSSTNILSGIQSFAQSPEALLNMMMIYILFDVGLYDFRRIFGSQAMFLVDFLEKRVFPLIDTELQGLKQSTASSVQLRFYLDACYNIIQSRKYLTPPEGRTMAAAKESELNPDM